MVQAVSVNDLIPSSEALFEDLNHLKVWDDCMTRSVSPSPGDTVSTALLKVFFNTT